MFSSNTEQAQSISAVRRTQLVPSTGLGCSGCSGELCLSCFTQQFQTPSWQIPAAFCAVPASTSPRGVLAALGSQPAAAGCGVSRRDRKQEVTNPPRSTPCSRPPRETSHLMVPETCSYAPPAPTLPQINSFNLYSEAFSGNKSAVLLLFCCLSTDFDTRTTQ